MSRTDVHEPYWVRVQRGGKFVYEVHDHSKGPCDIEKFSANGGRWYKNRSNCYPTVEFSHYFNLFGAPRFFKEERRHSHHRTRAKLRQALDRVKFDTEYEEDMILPADVREEGRWY